MLRVVDHEGRKSLTEDLTEAQRLGKIGSWHVELATGESVWSQEMFQVLGRDPALGPMSLEEFRASVVEEDRPAVCTRTAHRSRLTEELRFRRPDGRLAWLRMESRTVLDAAGEEPARLMASAQDITEQKELELKLREAGRVSAMVRGSGHRGQRVGHGGEHSRPRPRAHVRRRPEHAAGDVPARRRAGRAGHPRAGLPRA